MIKLVESKYWRGFCDCAPSWQSHKTVMAGSLQADGNRARFATKDEGKEKKKATLRKWVIWCL